jgi:hypothetical protein
MVKTPTRKNHKEEMLKIMSNPRYRGKHVIAVAGRVFTAKTGAGASKIFAKVRKQYPDKIPAITYIPDADSLIV